MHCIVPRMQCDFMLLWVRICQGLWSVLLFEQICKLIQPNNYSFLSWKIFCIGLKFPRIFYFISKANHCLRTTYDLLSTIYNQRPTTCILQPAHKVCYKVCKLVHQKRLHIKKVYKIFHQQVLQAYSSTKSVYLQSEQACTSTKSLH